MQRIVPIVIAALLLLPLGLYSRDHSSGLYKQGALLNGEVPENYNLFQAENMLGLNTGNNEPGHKPGRFSFKIGGGFHYLTDEPGKITEDFDSDGLAFLANAQLSIRYGIRVYGENQDKDRASAFGLFARYGVLPDTGFDGDFPFYEIEAGWVFREWIRVSGGIGNQSYEFNGHSESVDYYTATGGIVLRFGRLELDVNLSGLFDEDFEHDPSFRANATLNLHFRGGGN